MKLTIETFWDGQWRESANLMLRQPESGHRSPSDIEYDLDYFVKVAAADRAAKGKVRDARAVSVRCPVDLESRHLETWPPFLLDLMPQGHARRKLVEHLHLKPDAPETDLPLLMRAAGNSIGNHRIREAAVAETERLAGVVRSGVEEDDVFWRSERFDEVVERFAMIASGSSGLQGEWPKVALTLAKDGLYYPDTFVGDEEAVSHVIVKLLRSREERDRLILEGEAGYSALARHVGLRVHAVSRYAPGVLVIPRFDRRVGENGVERAGQESMTSAIGVAEFGRLASHEDYVEVLRRHADDAYADILEYVKRDIANRAFGNPDNHGRNTAFAKGPDGTVGISPLFDFAPMRLAVEGVVRSTRWACMRDHNMDHMPDWKAVCRAVFPGEDGTDRRLLADIAEFASGLVEAKRIAAEFGIAREVVDHAMRDCEAVVDNVLAAA
jgi:serine/threonine-protein kinase HipA